MNKKEGELMDMEKLKINSKTSSQSFLIGIIVIGLIASWKYWVPIVLAIIVGLWNLITPSSYALFLYKNPNAVRGSWVPDQWIGGYSSLKACQEKGVEFTQKGYAQFSCGERCKDHPIGEIDCSNVYY